ncbi:MAG TPA: hypothetical protein VFM31_02705 [Nitrososphaeraceae archaeon]|nr:hypothetical protein [Nitrososphaeraceae archaeon]
MDDIFIENKEIGSKNEYVCRICGKKFGESLGDMELHQLISHIQSNE